MQESARRGRREFVLPDPGRFGVQHANEFKTRRSRRGECAAFIFTRLKEIQAEQTEQATDAPPMADEWGEMQEVTQK